MKRIIQIFIILSALVLSACQSEMDKNSTMEENPAVTEAQTTLDAQITEKPTENVDMQITEELDTTKPEQEVLFVYSDTGDDYNSNSVWVIDVEGNCRFANVEIKDLLSQEDWYDLLINNLDDEIKSMVTGGGYALWGAVGGTVAAALIVAKASRQPLGKLLDALAAPAALMICITRFSENFIGEGHGITIENPLFCRFPFCVNVWDEWHLAVFVFEGIAALVIFMIMLDYSPARDGDGARKFLILYGSCQVLLESLRRDNFLRWFLVRVSQLTAVIVMLFMIIAAIVRWSKAPDKAQTKARVIICTVIFFLCVGGCIGIEFAVDKSDWPYVILYTLLAVCAAGLGITTHQIVFADSPRIKPRHIASGNR